MESSADFGPSVHTICEARGGSSVSRIPMSFPARRERGGRRGKRKTHLGLALHRGRAREDILHLDVRHVDRGECDCCPARLSSETRRATTRLMLDGFIIRFPEHAKRVAPKSEAFCPSCMGGMTQRLTVREISRRAAKISEKALSRSALFVGLSVFDDSTSRPDNQDDEPVMRRRGLPCAFGSTQHPARASSEPLAPTPTTPRTRYDVRPRRAASAVTVKHANKSAFFGSRRGALEAAPARARKAKAIAARADAAVWSPCPAS